MGFAINDHDVHITASIAESFSIKDKRYNKLSFSQSLKLIELLSSVQTHYDIGQCIAIDIDWAPPAHSGFGTGTALALALVEAYLIMSEVQYTESELVALSGRGTTSGVGVNTYFGGGFIFDLGHKHHPGLTHKPSSKQSNTTPPLKLVQLNMPDWEFGIFTPFGGNKFSGQAELDFFLQTCPIPHEEACRTLYHSVFGVLASVLEQDKETFCEGLNSLQNTKWKSSEIALHGSNFKITMSKIASLSSAVAMSSMGPTLFFLSERMSDIQNSLSNDNIEGSFSVVRPNNTGRIINYV